MFNGSGEDRVFVLVEQWQSTDQHRAQLELIVSGGGWEYILSHLETRPSAITTASSSSRDIDSRHRDLPLAVTGQISTSVSPITT
jgi:hypothetical protein